MTIFNPFLVLRLVLGLAESVPLGLRDEMKRLEVDTVLVLPSSAIDEYPVWSPDGRYLLANVMGTWHQADLRAIVLVPGKWRGIQVGVTKSPDYITTADPTNVEKWKPAKKPDADVAQATGVRIEFKRKELRTSLVVTEKGKSPRVLWTSDLEVCGAPVVSPDATLVAFLCETNGLLVMTVK